MRAHHRPRVGGSLTVYITQAGELAALNGSPTHFQLAAETHRFRLAFLYDPYFAVSVSYLDRQVKCGKNEGLDILARDRTIRDYVVIELKRDQGDDEVVGQVACYMGWIKQQRADIDGVGVGGIIVAHQASERLRSAALPHPNISLYTCRF